MSEQNPASRYAFSARLGWRLERRPLCERDSSQAIDQDLFFRPALHCALVINDPHNQVVLDLDALLKSVHHPGEYFLFNCECGLADDAGIMEEISVLHPNAHFIVWDFEAHAYRALLSLDSRFATRDARIRLIFTRAQYEADLQRMVDEAKLAHNQLELCEIAPNDYRFTEDILSGRADLPVRPEAVGKVAREPQEVTLPLLDEAISRWEQSVHSIAAGFDCSEEYTLDLSERECLQETLNSFEAQGLAVPDVIRARIEAADRRFVELTYEVEHDVWGSSRRYDKEAFWYYYRWPSM
ncbi:MAG: hypothetical protein PHH36_02360 [Sideroxydans sp.]|nr:hypothetical protein [Sideroxydans sp.]